MRFVLALGLVTLFSLSSVAQYWIGPKVGYHYTLHDYQDDNYLDDYKVNDDYNYELGLAVTYTASDRYAVHGELFYEQINHRVRNKDSDNFGFDSNSTYRYLSFPILLRVTMGQSPVHWYLNGGPKVSFWMSGKGNIRYSDDEANYTGIADIDYKIVFHESKTGEGGKPPFYVFEANRIQYSLTAGGGFYLDLASGARLMFDFRYNWGHSNMAFNQDPNVTNGTLNLSGSEAPIEGYQENYEFTHNALSMSIAYMFEYNVDFKRKGGSTSNESKKTKKSAKVKRRKYE